MAQTDGFARVGDVTGGADGLEKLGAKSVRVEDGIGSLEFADF